MLCCLATPCTVLQRVLHGASTRCCVATCQTALQHVGLRKSTRTLTRPRLKASMIGATTVTPAPCEDARRLGREGEGRGCGRLLVDRRGRRRAVDDCDAGELQPEVRAVARVAIGEAAEPALVEQVVRTLPRGHGNVPYCPTMRIAWVTTRMYRTHCMKRTLFTDSMNTGRGRSR